MRGKLSLLAGVCASAFALPAYAQDTSDAAADEDVIIVTAQRSNQRLQDVPIAVSAFSAEALEEQQIKNTSDLQLTLPNVTFTKGNFTGSSFTIRGIGDLCVGVSCDSATAIHMNDAPLFATRLFEGEFYDLAQIEVLRGPQGTLFGRNATSGVVNFRTARPDLSGFSGNAEAEYGNYNGVKVKGAINTPIGETVGLRVAGFYLNRDGYTTNIFNNTKIDDRDLWGARASLRFEPSSSTTIDLMAQYFHERDNRMRIQKQLCQRDPTGVLGCLNGSRDYQITNSNTSFVGVLTSREFFAMRGLPTAFALGSLYGPDAYTGAVNPADPRVVSTDHTPTYFAEEWIVQGSVDQDLGGGLNLKLSGNWQQTKIDSSQDYNISVQNRSLYTPALTSLAAANSGALGAALQAYLSPIYRALTPSGPAGPLCTSLAEETGTGAFSGKSFCSNTPQDFDRSNQNTESWSAEMILSSDWDGMFNFLVGGIYGKFSMDENSYYVNAFGIDYLSGVLGSFTTLGLGATPSYLGTPFFRNNTDQLDVKTYGLFGEAYFKFNDKIKLTLGLRYNNDEKTVRARSTLASWLTPYTATNAFTDPGIRGGGFDADPATNCAPAIAGAGSATPGALGSIAGCEALQFRKAKFDAWTGRAVLDYQISPDNLVYVSYSRGYKSGGINPPLQPIFAVPEGFSPEFVNAFEIGSKNQFGNVTLNLTGFYYQYKSLQLSRIVARTSVNDNVSANIWGLEAEAIFRPTRELTLNMNASYLNTKVSEDKLLSNPRDFGAGRADAVILKDITNGANCAVSANNGTSASANAFVNQVNTLINNINAPGNPLTTAGTGLQPGAGLQPTTPFPAGGGIRSTGAFSVCAIAGSLAASPLGAAFGGITYHSAGIATNIRGNKLPGAPDYKFSAGIQYEAPLGDMTLTPRADFIYTGKSYGNIFNGAINEISSYTQVNAQLQLEGPNKKWFARIWVQNLFDKDAITGLYVTDQSSGNYTNIFTLEPRRYGLAAGFRF
ncbi:MAG: TonB-dependent receptor [Brevundimonas sp.]|jgi:iron complex outermembrane receptor protein|nr:TonB-dependent receptor [Brevundimonas sp.]